MTNYVEDLNRRLNAGLSVRRTQTTFEVHEFEKADALVEDYSDGCEYSIPQHYQAQQ